MRVLQTQNAIDLAERHIGGEMRTSAVQCLDAAVRAFNQCDKVLYEADYATVRMWVLRSLQYSVGMYHAAYKQAASMLAPPAPLVGDDGLTDAECRSALKEMRRDMAGTVQCLDEARDKVRELQAALTLVCTKRMSAKARKAIASVAAK